MERAPRILVDIVPEIVLAGGLVEFRFMCGENRYRYCFTINQALQLDHRLSGVIAGIADNVERFER